ncbi:MAG: 3-oxoacyl-ACP synthase [Candidatus Rokuibacteriota bacterium]|jgi:3-oxoacyl-[acyl-carrier-protein] synthase-3|nr:MAG: 3-oxoacyl-ACP synthase [Candidatus Rokubacteria bacterium]
MKKAKIVGTGMAVPECVVDNHLLARCFATSDEWITQRTGIKERRVSPSTYEFLQRLAEAPDKDACIRQVYDHGLDGKLDAAMTPADLGYEASQMALKNAGLQIDDIDFIVDTTTIPEYAYPHTGCVMAQRFGLTSTPVLNLQQGCSGFVYALATADAYIRMGMYERVLVVGAEMLSPMMEYSDRGRDMAVLFADGAGAVVLQAVDPSSRSGLISHHLHTDATIVGKLFAEIYGNSTYPLVSKQKIDDGRARPRMNGRTVFTQAVRRFKEVMQEALGANGLKPTDVDLYLFHQANLRIIEAIGEFAKIPPAKMFNNIQKYGNTSAASVPIVMHEAFTEGRIREGDLVLTAAFGAGFAWGATLLRW